MNKATKTLKKPFRLACVWAVMGVLTAGSAEATLFSFSGSDLGGTGSATMDVGILGNVLTVELDNTSPLQLADNTGTNTPGITGFGVNLADPLPTLTSWTLTAYNTNGTGPVTIGSSAGCGGTCDWLLSISSNVQGLTLDFFPNLVNGIQGALYNPSATSGFAALPNFETQAVLTLNFNSAPVLATGDCGSGVGSCATLVRMQNVGRNGTGSLKLPGTTSSSTSSSTSSGTPTSTGDIPNAPEPSSLTLLGLGLIASVFALRRRSLQA